MTRSWNGDLSQNRRQLVRSCADDEGMESRVGHDSCHTRNLLVEITVLLSDLAPYSRSEAIEAFRRVGEQHGWRLPPWTRKL